MSLNFRIERDDKIVAYGHQFISGKCVVEWQGKYKSIVIWESLEDLKAVNGHPGTKFIFY